MKVYVDELPECCRECPCSIYDELDCCWCKAINGELTYITDNDFESKRLNSCPLQSLADYTKQVRKEVCEIFRKAINECERDYYNEFLRYGHPHIEKYYRGYDFIRAGKLKEILDQIQGERE